MTLSERLEQAKRARLIAEGKLSGEAALKPEPGIEATNDPTIFLFEPVKIEVASGPGVHPVADLNETKKVDAQTRTETCPNCGRGGTVDMVDLVGHRTHFTCGTCGAMWHVVDAENAKTKPR